MIKYTVLKCTSSYLSLYIYIYIKDVTINQLFSNFLLYNIFEEKEDTVPLLFEVGIA